MTEAATRPSVRQFATKAGLLDFLYERVDVAHASDSELQYLARFSQSIEDMASTLAQLTEGVGCLIETYLCPGLQSAPGCFMLTASLQTTAAGISLPRQTAKAVMCKQDGFFALGVSSMGDLGGRSRKARRRLTGKANFRFVVAHPISLGWAGKTAFRHHTVTHFLQGAIAPARPEQIIPLVYIDIIQRAQHALREATLAASDLDALDIASNALRQLVEIARAEARHD